MSSSSAGVFGAAAADGFLTHQTRGDQQMSAVLWMQAALTLWAVIFFGESCWDTLYGRGAEKQNNGALFRTFFFFFFNGTWKTV